MNIRILFTAILLTIASVAHADKWTEILDTYATDTTTRQIVLEIGRASCRERV